ncbi:FecR family protein [Sphingomonas sp. CJ20]
MSDRIEDMAARWALRHPLDATGRAALDAWLASDPRHQGALLRAMAGLSAVGRALAPAPEAAEPEAAPRFGRRRLFAGMAGAIAASVAGMVGWQYLAVERVSTARGEIRRLPLADGSVATINTESTLRVDFASDTRRVALDRGQAWFQVAKDRTRPFVVDAGIAQARAVGTAFSVERRDDGVEIAVTEGVVAVWPTDADGAMTILEAGQFARFRPGAVTPVKGSAPAAITRALAWRGGEIALENETVASAVDQFNRYNRQQLVIVDPQLAGKRLVGLFQIDKPGDFAATLAASLDVAVTTTPTEIRLDRKK